MATFALYLTAAMMRLEPPTDWNEIVELALNQMHATSNRNYCAKQLHKALEVGLRFGIIKELNEKYYLHEYGRIDAEGNANYEFDNITFGKLADIRFSDEDLTKHQPEISTNTNMDFSDMLTKWRRVGLRTNELILKDLCNMDMIVDQKEINENDNMATNNVDNVDRGLCEESLEDIPIEPRVSNANESNVLTACQLIEENVNLNQVDIIKNQYNSTQNDNYPDSSEESKENSDDFDALSDDFQITQSAFPGISNTNESEDFSNFVDNLINDLLDIDEYASESRIENVSIQRTPIHFPLKRQMYDCERPVKRLRID